MANILCKQIFVKHCPASHYHDAITIDATLFNSVDVQCIVHLHQISLVSIFPFGPTRTGHLVHASVQDHSQVAQDREDGEAGDETSHTVADTHDHGISGKGGMGVQMVHLLPQQ